MKGITRGILAISLAGVLSLTPAAFSAGSSSAVTVYAHGHHGGGCHGGYSASSTNYYYCGGHSAHTHSGGVCPYTSTHYYCGGHSAHTHAYGSCPYNAYSVSSNTVRRVQNVLNKCGYACGAADGVLGTNTKRALRKYQKANGLKVDGIIGRSTIRAMGL